MDFFCFWFSSGFWNAANHSLCLLIRWLGSHISTSSLKLSLDFLETQVELNHHSDHSVLVSILQLMTCLTEQNAAQLSVETIQQWLQLSKWVLQSSRKQILLSLVAKLFRAMIKVKNVPLLIEVYRHLAADLYDAFNTMQQQQQQQKKDNCSSLVTEAEENALLLLSPLADLGMSSIAFISNSLSIWMLVDCKGNFGRIWILWRIFLLEITFWCIGFYFLMT